MSIPPLNRPTPPAPLSNREPQVEPSQDEEVLMITFSEDESDNEAIKVSFAGSGFDVTNEDIILDLIRLAANSYGYDLTEI